MSRQNHPALITALLDPAAYDHPCRDIQLIETHISWLLLTGDYAYKIKKPVDFGFLDFSTLALRKYFCTEEIRLNARLAPQIYLRVVRISASITQPRINGDGPALEYAVKMRQFDNSGLFDRLVSGGQLSPQIISDTAGTLAHFHEKIAVAGPDSPFGEPGAVHQPVCENFEQLERHAASFLAINEHHDTFQHIRRWSEQAFTALEPILARRKTDGFIRECHGDLHLGNIALIDGRVTPFDGIEFNPDLRWIDIMSEIAFLLMDLQDHQRADLAHRLLNAWLEISGDYSGLTVLRYYQCYRAMVRAKVAALRGNQTTSENTQSDLSNYIQLADEYTRPTRPALLITHGLSGSGKSWLTQALLETTGMIRLRSDVERKRLAGLAPLAHSDSAPGAELYTAEFTQRTFTRLADLTRRVLRAGYVVVVDATFIKRSERKRFRQLAHSLAIPFRIIHCETDIEILRQRIGTRQTEGQDASEAGLSVLELQLKNQEPLDKNELGEAFIVNTKDSVDLSPIEHWLKNPNSPDATP